MKEMNIMQFNLDYHSMEDPWLELVGFYEKGGSDLKDCNAVIIN